MPNQRSIGLAAGSCLAIVALGTTALIPFATAVAAAPASNAPPQAMVKFADLDLASDAGASTLLRRIEAAARMVCGNPREIQPLAQLLQVQQCNAQAIGRAVTVIGAPKVTLAYRARYSAASMG